MLTLAVTIVSFAAFIIAYNTYGCWLSTKVFGLDDSAEMPSQQLRDDVDYVPTRKSVLFGHHFTSIAGTGPIVGPAIAVFWGWLPALIWVVLGSIFVGAVHDFGALVVSMRNRGQTLGEVAGRLISRRARILFLLILFFALTVVLAIFGLVIAGVFRMYPESVLSVWVAMPVAIAIGYHVYRRNGTLLIPSLLALVILYGCVWLGVYHLPISLPGSANTQTIVWTFILMAYCFAASVMPVWLLLQPRDYINSHQLVVALALLIGGVAVAGITNRADLAGSAPAIVAADELPANTPPIWPFLFITVACGACSGFHCLVSSGTSSKQLACESDSQFVAYGSMLMEGALAVLVILACCAGLGMGRYQKADDGTWTPMVSAAGEQLTGRAAWRQTYDAQGDWDKFRLPQTVGAFVEGSANFLTAIGVPLKLGVGIVAVLVACFAATTLDSATRLQRYVIQELATTFHVVPLQNKYAATGLAVSLGLLIAMLPGPSGYGTGGLLLWPLFGATNQMLAGLAFMVIVFYLVRRGKPLWFAMIPAIFMLIVPTYGLIMQLFGNNPGFFSQQKYLLGTVGAIILALQVWMIIECIILLPRVRGVLEEALPPLKNRETVPTPEGHFQPVEGV
ncbi:MAG: carbon starvation protein A [Planctomycetaceae bacterium]|nr:carbon starvation protein A [Planctomycetaceae bacterium]